MGEIVEVDSAYIESLYNRIELLETKLDKFEALEAQNAKLREALRELTPYHAKDNSWGKREAIESAMGFLRSKTVCTHTEAVSDCVRCSLELICSVLERQIKALRETEG